MNDEIKKNTLLFEGIDLFEKKKYAEAYEFFSKKVLDNPKDIEANMYLGLIGLDHLNKKDAWINIKVFFDSNMSNPENWKLFIRSLIFGDKINDAKNIMSIAEEKGLDKNFLSLMDIQLKDAEFNIIKEMTSKETFFTDNETFNKNKAIDEVVIFNPKNYDIEEIKDLAEYKFYDELKIKSENFTKKFPNHPFGWEYLALSYLNISDYQNALNMYQKVLEIEPEHDAIKVNIAVCYVKLNQNDKAKKLLEKIKKKSEFFEIAQNYLNRLR